MKKTMVIVALLVALGAVQGDLLGGLFTRNRPYYDDLWRERMSGRYEGIRYGREQALLGAAGAYAGYRALNWAYNRYFRTEQKHLENLFASIAKTAREVQKSANKAVEKAVKKEDMVSRDEAMLRAQIIANMIEKIAAFYQSNQLTSGKLYDLKAIIDASVREKSEYLDLVKSNEKLVGSRRQNVKSNNQEQDDAMIKPYHQPIEFLP